MEIIEMVSAWETKNKYVLKNANAQQVSCQQTLELLEKKQISGVLRFWGIGYVRKTNVWAETGVDHAYRR